MRRSWFWPFVFGAVSLLPRLLLIGRDRLWYDESFTAWMTTLPVGQQVLATTADVHPPLWYLIETLAARLLGTSEIALRLPAALFGAAAVVETYLLIRQITGDREAKWAAGLMAIMPAQIYYSQEARMYTLLTWLVLLAARGILSGRWGRVWPALALILYCHNTGPIYVAILGGAVLVKGGWKTALKVAAPAGLAWLPWLPGLYTQITSMNSSFWLQPSGIGGAVYSFFVTAFYQRTPHLFQAQNAAPIWSIQRRSLGGDALAAHAAQSSGAAGRPGAGPGRHCGELLRH
jgi:predicted membrane-bound mannosyltransferase